jgi:hypothetical protein
MRHGKIAEICAYFGAAFEAAERRIGFVERMEG